MEFATKDSLKKSANAEILDTKLTLENWEKLYGSNSFGSKRASVAIRKVAAAQTKYLLSHCTIMASVMTEPDPEDWLIKPECSHLVNNNEDGWTNEVLKMSHKSFIGSFNFVEHYQNSKHAKGHILDSVLRKVKIGDGAWVYFCDILVATDRTHEQLTNGIIAGDVRYMSMGCVTDMVICSYCGKRIEEGDRYCIHLQVQKGSFIPDQDGINRRVAELCGHKSLPNGGVRFVEASWVGVPAFPGAALRNIVQEEWLGPRTKYTSESREEGFAKAASSMRGGSGLEGATLADFNRMFKG